MDINSQPPVIHNAFSMPSPTKGWPIQSSQPLVPSTNIAPATGSNFFSKMPALPDWKMPTVPKEALQAAIGTNYDPYDAKQTKKNPDGIGAGGVPMTPDMVAVSRKPNSSEPVVPYGTVIFVPELNKQFTVADIKNERYNDASVHGIDFVTPHQGSKIAPEYNKPLTYKVIKLGNGRADLKQPAPTPTPTVTITHASPLESLKQLVSGWPTN